MSGSNGSVTIRAPVAEAAGASPIGIVDERLLLLEENRALRRELEQARVGMRTLASVAVALARMVNDEGGPLDREIVIARDVYERLAGCEVGVTEDTDRNLVVRIRDNLQHPVWEGR